MLTAILISLAVVFVAELGDKSQLITMTYALRHKWWVVLSGVVIAAMLVHGLSVAIGHFLGLTLPERPIAFAGAIAFLLFAAWTWRESRGSDSDVRVAEPRFVVFAIVSTFVLAELGDKTMLATVTLASDHNWAGVWIGATAGMVLADGVAIAAGALLHKRLPAQFLHSLAAVQFLVFGLWLLFDGALGLPGVALAVTGSIVAAIGTVSLARLVRRRNSTPTAAPSLELP
jgi:putative Ca2+/H+ antiporter (TMEM165/GDT1 family)